MRDFYADPSASLESKNETNVDVVLTIVFQSINVALDENNMGPSLGENAI